MPGLATAQGNVCLAARQIYEVGIRREGDFQPRIAVKQAREPGNDQMVEDRVQPGQSNPTVNPLIGTFNLVLQGLGRPLDLFGPPDGTVPGLCCDVTARQPVKQARGKHRFDRSKPAAHGRRIDPKLAGCASKRPGPRQGKDHF